MSRFASCGIVSRVHLASRTRGRRRRCARSHGLVVSPRRAPRARSAARTSAIRAARQSCRNPPARGRWSARRDRVVAPSPQSRAAQRRERREQRGVIAEHVARPAARQRPVAEHADARRRGGHDAYFASRGFTYLRIIATKPSAAAASVSTRRSVPRSNTRSERDHATLGSERHGPLPLAGRERDHVVRDESSERGLRLLAAKGSCGGASSGRRASAPRRAHRRPPRRRR